MDLSRFQRAQKLIYGNNIDAVLSQLEHKDGRANNNEDYQFLIKHLKDTYKRCMDCTSGYPDDAQRLQNALEQVTYRVICTNEVAC